jgi:hypothetical protein
LGLSAGNATTAGFITVNEEGFDTDFRVEASGVTHALFVRGSDGKVGINTDTPISNLHVASSGGGRIQFTSDSSGHTVSDGLAMAMDGVLRSYFWVYENAYMEFATNNTSQMILSASGQLGIGAAPGTLLELNGTAPYLTIKNSTHEDTGPDPSLA